MNLLNRLPVISRARGYRLYCSSGMRILDFYQDGGKAVLGHRVSGISLSMKQALDKGVFFSCRTRYDIRLENAVKTFAGKNTAYSIFSSDEILFSRLKRNIPPFFPAAEKKTDSAELKRKDTYKNLNVFSGSDIICSDEESAEDTAFWHPFSGDRLKDLLMDFTYVVPVIPFPGSWSPGLVLSSCSPLPESGPVSPAVLAPYISSVYKLINSEDNNLYDNWDSVNESISKLWERKGIYLIPCYDECFHEKIFSTFLEKGYLISPDYNIPTILPGEISKGEKDNFIKTIIKVSGEIL